jgi:hypothetical protein
MTCSWDSHRGAVIGRDVLTIVVEKLFVYDLAHLRDLESCKRERKESPVRAATNPDVAQKKTTPMNLLVPKQVATP